MAVDVCERTKRSDILLTALGATEGAGLLSTRLVDISSQEGYILEWFSIAEDIQRLKDQKDRIIATIQSGHADCQLEHSTSEYLGKGLNLTLRVQLPKDGVRFRG
ncbi:hypothetical protein [uncultured Pseudoteredinibacter sp.]|uniref:hypothetical protein n=1 Tax=uncultured Pseudoteredinibacter sp. TaxID=1641701 RepID=UPI002606A3F4|nr:hypothetical protein [uncultured Pseudoteredinibacter sp.]